MENDTDDGNPIYCIVKSNHSNDVVCGRFVWDRSRDLFCPIIN